MSGILWGILIVLFIPLFAMVWARLYNKVVSDFSPDKKKRQEAKKADANYEEAIHRYGDSIGNLFWGIIKLFFKYGVPTIIVIILIFYLTWNI